MSRILIVFPHQLFKLEDIQFKVDEIYLVEEYLFFKQYSFHKQKLVFHRASMQYYSDYLSRNKFKITYIESQNALSDIRQLMPFLKTKGVSEIVYTDVTDFLLQKRLSVHSKKHAIQLTELPSPLFITSKVDNSLFFDEKKKYFQTDYYIWQRKRLNILLDENKKPIGGKWTFDAENRLKFPKGTKAPIVKFPKLNDYYKEAIEYVIQNFPNNNGEINLAFIYPTTHEEAEVWLEQFLKTRFVAFGDYEDAMVQNESIIHHSVLTPMLNVGLLTPKQVLGAVLSYSDNNEVPINSLEGFIRQIIGWREFIRAVYEREGVKQRTKNYWQFDRKIPSSFYNASTGIVPVDDVIRKVNKTAYAHHIERLMVLGNFMVLCEFHPNEVYRWFMELFIDAYDWVMVPNVYGMTQFADGGLMTTKPYISGSNYVFKMSDYTKSKTKVKKSDTWESIWDGLFWRFMYEQKTFFSQNPRLGMLLNMFHKMPIEKQTMHLENANHYLISLYSKPV
jgi:deoxyribodipyrimidine photolyase-related protein